MKLAILLALGALGVFIRYMVAQGFGSSQFPWATLLVNITGGFLIGFVYAKWGGGPDVPIWYTGLVVGLLGGLTTFSTYSLETLRLFEGGRHMFAAFSLTANNLFCLGACYIGMRLGRNLLA